MIMALGNDGIIDWEGISVKDFPRYKKIRKVLKDELEESWYSTVDLSEAENVTSSISDYSYFDIDTGGAILNDNIELVFKTLTPREVKILRLRFGIGVDKVHTFEEIAQMIDVTRERIRQIMLKSLRKLRHPTRVKLLKGFENGHSWGR